MKRALVPLLALGLGLPVRAATLAGVTMADSVDFAGRKLVLNGLGLREKYTLDVYVGGLYLPEKTHDASRVIDDDVPKRVVMQFVREVPAEKLAETMRESINAAGSVEAAKYADQLASWMEDVSVGDVVALDYVPGAGTTVVVKGKRKGTIPGLPFMRAAFGIYVGPIPPTEALKQGLLGL